MAGFEVTLYGRFWVTPEAERFFRMANDVKPMQPETIMGWARTLLQDNRASEAENLAVQLIENEKTYTPIYDLLYRHYAAAGRLTDAEKILLRKTANNPEDSQSVLELAGFYAVNAKEDAMKAALQPLVDNPKTFPQAHLQVGDFYSRMQRWDEALQHYRQGAQANLKDKILYLKKTAAVWLAQGKGEQAGQVVAEILKQDPSDEAARAVKASLLLASGKPESVSKSIAEFQQLVDKSPHNPDWRFNLGRALAANGDTDRARSRFQEAIDKRHDFLPPRMALADLSVARGDYRAALRYADEILAINRNVPAIRLLRAVSLIHMGTYVEARQELAGLEKLFPDEAQLQFANIDLKERHFRQAEDRFAKLLQKKPGSPRAVSGLVQVYLAENRFDKAASFLENELKKAPGSDVARSLLAETHVRSGKYDLAIEQYKRLLITKPNSPQLYLALGTTYRLKGDLSNAIPNFERAGLLAPKDPAPPTLIAQAQTDSGQKAAAIQNFRRALQLSPDDVSLLNNLAYLIVDSGGNLDEALILAQRALQMAPQQPNLTDTLGWIYFKKNWNDSALQVFGGLAQKYPDNPTFHYHFGMALLQKGDKTTAHAELKSGLSNNPSAEVRQSIEIALAKM